MGKLRPDPDPNIAAAQRAFHSLASRYGNDELARVLSLRSTRTLVRICAGDQRPPPGMADDLANHLLETGLTSETLKTHYRALRLYAENGRRLKEHRDAKA